MKITFVNNFVSTRGGFKHETLLSIDSTIVRKSVCHYSNRTWESYAFQSVMKKAIDEEVNSERNILRQEFKDKTGLKRLSKSIIFTNDRIVALLEKRDTL